MPSRVQAGQAGLGMETARVKSGRGYLKSPPKHKCGELS